MADAKALLLEAKVCHENACVTLGIAEWAVHDACIALSKAVKELLKRELVVWRTAEKSSRVWGMRSHPPPTLVCTRSSSCPGSTPK